MIDLSEYKAESEMLTVSVTSDGYNIDFNGVDEEGDAEVYSRSLLIMPFYDE